MRVRPVDGGCADVSDALSQERLRLIHERRGAFRREVRHNSLARWSCSAKECRSELVDHLEVPGRPASSTSSAFQQYDYNIG